MAHPRAVAIRRQNADIRLRRATEAAAQRFGVAFQVPGTPPTRYPDLYAAELVENVAEFIEALNRAAAPAPAGAAAPNRQRRIA